jgi:hypothetical protein
MVRVHVVKMRMTKRESDSGEIVKHKLHFSLTGWAGAQKVQCELSVLGIEGVVSIGSASVTLTGIMRRLKLYLHDDDNEELARCAR